MMVSPYETNNIATEHPEEVARMQAILENEIDSLFVGAISLFLSLMIVLLFLKVKFNYITNHLFKVVSIDLLFFTITLIPQHKIF